MAAVTSIRAARARLMRIQAAQLLLTAHELEPRPDGLALIDAVTALADDQQSDQFASPAAHAVAPQLGERQSIDRGQGVHAGHDPASRGTCQ